MEKTLNVQRFYIHQNYLLLYRSLKIVVRLAIRIFCRKIIINKPGVLGTQGPLLLACNHPNSYLDAVILDALFRQPVHSLARGDVFVNKFISALLTSLKILPVYRVSEGVENLSSNYNTFEECKKIFRRNGIILIFSEGKCVNEWHLRPLKKGTARLAIDTWLNDIPLTVLPVGINYSSFRKFGKNVFLNFGNEIHRDEFDLNLADGTLYQQFNAKLKDELEQLVYEIPARNRSERRKKLTVEVGIDRKILLLIPAIIGFIIHIPLYFPIKLIARNTSAHNDHYDSIMVTLLLFSYPFYLLALTMTGIFITGSFWFLLLPVVSPIGAWALVQGKKQM